MNKAIRDFKNKDISVEIRGAEDLIELCSICENFGINTGNKRTLSEIYRYPTAMCYLDQNDNDLYFGCFGKNISLSEFKRLMNYA